MGYLIASLIRLIASLIRLIASLVRSSRMGYLIASLISLIASIIRLIASLIRSSRMGYLIASLIRLIATLISLIASLIRSSRMVYLIASLIRSSRMVYRAGVTLRLEIARAHALAFVLRCARRPGRHTGATNGHDSMVAAPRLRLAPGRWECRQRGRRAGRPLGRRVGVDAQDDARAAYDRAVSSPLCMRSTRSSAAAAQVPQGGDCPLMTTDDHADDP